MAFAQMCAYVRVHARVCVCLCTRARVCVCLYMCVFNLARASAHESGSVYAACHSRSLVC